METKRERGGVIAPVPVGATKPHDTTWGNRATVVAYNMPMHMDEEKRGLFFCGSTRGQEGAATSAGTLDEP